MDEFKIVLVAVIFNRKTGKVLIGRRENDKHIESLTWSFIGGRLNYDECPNEKICFLVKDSVGISISSVKLICSMPHQNQKKVFVNYFFCELEDIDVEASGSFVELKWVYAKSIEHYFTTTLQPDVKKYIMSILS